MKENINFDNKNSASKLAQEAHKDFGKVPKYIKTYKKDADLLAKQRAELQELKKLPPGTRQISEDERVKTLEDLVDSKKEL